MSDLEISDAQIAALTTEDRRDLIERLQRSTSPVWAAGEAQSAGAAAQESRRRRRRLLLVIASAVCLVPWTIYLGFTLPRHYVAGHWRLAWVGFDVMLIVAFAATAFFGFLRRQLLVLSAFVTGVLLICDAWFDVTTANAHDLPFSVADAALVEIPIAILLIGTSLHLLRLLLVRTYALEEDQGLWAVALHLGEPSRSATKPGSSTAGDPGEVRGGEA